MDALREKIEATLSAYPVCEYAFVKPKELPFRDEVRYICRTECPRYGTSWSCPPAVGTVEECRKRCLGYEDVLMFTTIAEGVDTEDMSAMLATRREHEEITRQIQSLRHLLLHAHEFRTFVFLTSTICSFSDAYARLYKMRLNQVTRPLPLIKVIPFFSAGSVTRIP